MRNRFVLATGAGLVAVALALGGVAAGRALGPADVASGSAAAALSRNATVVPGGMMALRYAGWPMAMAGGWAVYPPGIRASSCGAYGAVVAQPQVGS